MRLIDADALKKEVDNFQNCYNGWSDTYDKAYIIEAIEEAPTIDAIPIRPQVEWIPCSERLPDEFVDVLVCLTDGLMDVVQLTDYIDIDGEPKWCHSTAYTLGGAILNSEVVAWMSLPKPWKGADDERDS